MAIATNQDAPVVVTENWSRGDWMQTYTNRKFYPMDPRAEDVDPFDIARGISMQCRYNGHVEKFYSVAEHCVLIADYLWDNGAPVEEVIWGLLHDATEAYVGDMIRPLKRHMPDFSSAEDCVMEAILLRFNQMVSPMPQSVRDADNGILLDELAALKGRPPGEWETHGVQALGITIEAWSQKRAEDEYLKRLEALVGRDLLYTWK